MRLSRAMSLTILIALVFALVGCTALPQATAVPAEVGQESGNDTAENSETETASSESLIPIKVAVAPYLSYAAFYIALEEGYFEQEGIAIEIAQIARSSMAIPALLQGEVDALGTNLSTAILNAIARDGNAKIVASTAQQLTGQCTYTGILIRKGLLDATDGVLLPEQLPELRFNASPATLNEYTLNALLQQYGSSYDEVTLLDLPGSSQVVEPLSAGTLDIAVATEPWLTRAEAEGIGTVWLSGAEILGDIQTSVFIFGPNLLQSNQDAGVRFMRGYLQGVKQLQEGKTPRNLEILQKYYEMDMATLETLCLPSVPTDGKILVDSVTGFITWAVERDYIDRALTSEEFWEPAFVDAAAAGNAP